MCVCACVSVCERARVLSCGSQRMTSGVSLQAPVTLLLETVAWNLPSHLGKQQAPEIYPISTSLTPDLLGYTTTPSFLMWGEGLELRSHV